MQNLQATTYLCMNWGSDTRTGDTKEDLHRSHRHSAFQRYVEKHGGRVVETDRQTDEEILAVFPTASGAMGAAAEFQGAMRESEAGVTLAVHSGEAEECRRLCRTGRPGKIHGSEVRTEPPLHHLPAQFTSFVGREELLRQVVASLTSSRIVTLWGSGGAGKTRMALQVASAILQAFTDGAWFVELGPLSDPARVPQAIVSALGLRERPGATMTDLLLEHLRPRRLLLILDNCEHLAEHAAQVCQVLLAACPHLRILTTSREVLGIAGETVIQIPPLAVPVEVQGHSLAGALQYEGVRLFAERAAAASSSFALTERNLPAVIRICQHLDGIPLAIELAATRVRFLSVEEIAARMDVRFRLLACESQTAAPRQRTLQAAVDWSYNLLSPKEQTLWHRLSIFPVSFTMEAVEGICAGDGIAAGEVLHLLGQLVEKSVVLVADRTGATRYRLLETIRLHGRQKLAESGEEESLERRHFEWYLALARRAEPELTGGDARRWSAELDREYENCRAALQWAKRQQLSEQGLALSTGLLGYWYQSGRFAEGREWLELSLGMEAVPTSSLRARGLNAAGIMAERQGDYATARSHLEQAVAIWRECGDEGGLADSLGTLGLVVDRLGDSVRAGALHEQALGLFRKAGDQRGVARSFINMGDLAVRQGDFGRAKLLFSESLSIMREQGRQLGVATVLNNLGSIAMREGEYAEASALYGESRKILGGLGNAWLTAMVLYNLGLLSSRRGQYQEGVSLLKESLEIRRELGDRAGIAACLEGLAGLFLAQGESGRGLRVMGAAEAYREAIGAPLSPCERTERDRLVAEARGQHCPDWFASEWEAGHALSMEEAIVLAEVPVSQMQPAEKPAPVDGPVEAATAVTPLPGLTEREVEIVGLVIAGKTNREVGAQLHLSRRTVDSHLQRIFGKLKITSRAQLVAWAFRNGWAQP